MENSEKMENINQMTKNTLFMVKKSLFLTQNALGTFRVKNQGGRNF